MDRTGKSARAAVRRDLLIVAGDCPTEPECASFLRAGTCEGCPIEPNKRSTDWAPSALTVETRRVADLLEMGIGIDLASLSPLMVEAMLERQDVLEETRPMREARDAKREAEERRMWGSLRGNKHERVAD